MIQELINFVTDLEKNNPDIHLKKVGLKEGLYLFLRIDTDGKCTITEQLAYYDQKIADNKITKDQKLEDNDNKRLHKRCLTLQQVWLPVAQTKIFNPNAKIFGVTCSPFALGFNKKNIDGKDVTDTNAQTAKVKGGVIQYFDTAKKYIEVENEDKKKQYQTWYNTFSEYAKNNLFELLEGLEDYQNTKKGGDFNVFLILDEPSFEDFKIVHDAYFDKNIFNKEEFNANTTDGQLVGVPDSLYTYNNKKPYLQHKSSPFSLKYRTTGKEAKVIWQFYNLQKRILPNPLPIFIDKRELNKEMVTLYNDFNKVNFTDIITELFQNHTKDLGGYYLLFIQKGEIIDLDFVPNFQYYVKNCVLRQTACLNLDFKNKDGQQEKWKLEGSANNIFEFQNKVANSILGIELETKTKNEGAKWLKYFGEVEYNPKYMTDIQYNLFLKYRLAVYEYIYKSQRKAITKAIFDDIMISSIIDDLRHDEVKDNRHTKQYDIKEKILIWFSLFEFFEQKNKTNIDMINRTQQLYEELKGYAKTENASLPDVNPELFAFASGQLIREILQKSRSDRKTHALLEPFLQKTDVNLFKLAIARAFETYKHEFAIYGKKRFEFDRTMALVMGASDTTINVKELLPFTLAGYFADSIFVKEKETDSEN